MTRRIASTFVLGVLFLLAAATANAQAPAKQVLSMEGITEYQLANGLKVLLFPDPSTSTVTVNCTIFVGSRHEGYGETGMAHLLEHMVFKGTPKHKDIPKALRDHGAEFNGTTWVDRTNYYETMPASDDNVEFAIRLEADRLVNSLIRREDLLSEMTVVRNEFEMGENDPESILSQRMMAVAYEWHNYGKSTIGNRSDIERVPIDRLQGFYHKYYRPDNAMVIVAGKFDQAKALKWIEQYFGALAKPSTPVETTYTEEPAQDGERTVALRRVGKIGVVGSVYHIPAGAHPDYAAIEILNQVLVSQPSGRLYKALVASGKASSVNGAAFPWHDPGVLELAAQVDSKQSLEAVRDLLNEVVEKLPTQKPTTEEVDRAKRKLLRDRELLMARSNRIGVVLSEWAALGDWRLFFLHRDRLEQVTAEDVARVAERYLQRTNRTSGIFMPTAKSERTTVPETPVLAKLMANYTSKKTVVTGAAFEPTPENIEKLVQRTEVVPGLKVAILPKKNRGETVHVDLSLRYGNAQSLRGITSATQFLAPLMARGTTKKTRQQIEDEFDKLKARFRPGGLIGEASFTIECQKANLPAVLTLLGEILREPSFPAAELDILKRRQLETLEKSLTEPSALASRALQRKLHPYPPEDVRYVPTVQDSIERLKAVTLDQVKKLYAEQLGATGELVVVGDCEPEAVLTQIKPFLNDWQAKTAYERIARPAHEDIAGERVMIETPDKANAFYMAGHNLAMTDMDPDFVPLEVANFVFGGGTLSSRLGDRVRQKDGLSYGAASELSADAKDKTGRFFLFAICNPENMPKLDKAIAEEVQRFVKDGLREQELTDAKKAFLEQLKVDRSQDAALAGMLSEGLHVGRTMAYYADVEKQVAALTLPQVNEAVRKRLQPNKLVIVEAGDFKKATNR